MANVTTKQIVKTAAKKAAAKPATKAATKRAPVAKAETKAAPAVKFIIADYARPVAGTNLFAFTAAWLALTGLESGKAKERETLTKIAGDTAIAYHLKQKNLEHTKDGIALSAKGHNFFSARKADGKVQPAIVEAFQAIMTTGQADNVYVKAQSAIKAIA